MKILTASLAFAERREALAWAAYGHAPHANSPSCASRNTVVGSMRSRFRASSRTAPVTHPR